jgi:hypothetical protein
VRIELVFESNIPATLWIQLGDKLCFLQRGLFNGVEETHVSLKRKPPTLKTGAYRVLFYCEN